MEDPWVTPWTADSPAKLDLPAPPPHAHFSSENHLGPDGLQQDTQRRSPARTPWDEEDAWGGWNEPGRDSPGWGRSPGRSPGLSPGLKPVEGSLSRLPSPDPWAKLAVLETAHVGLDRFGNRSQERIVDASINSTDGTRDASTDRGQTPAVKVDDVKEITEDIWSRPDPEPTANLPEPTIDLPKPMMAEDITLPDSPAELAGSVCGSNSRPSTARKVHDLVDMYDGIARRTASPISPSMTATTKVSSLVEDGVPDLAGEQELAKPSEASPESRKDNEGISEIPRLVSASPRVDEVPLAKSGPDSPLTTEAVVQEKVAVSLSDDKNLPKEGQTGGHDPPDVVEEASIELQDEEPNKMETQEEVSASEEPVKAAPKPPKPPAIPYPIDMTGLDGLFPSTSASFPSPEPLPDVVIDDTFTSITERKAWYQMSRPGSIRKHNLGDDENYVRVSWGGSKVREQSIQIVRRWMEEDSIGLRVVLGRRRGPIGGKIFNWDSPAPTIEIGELLARRSHSRQTSTTSKATGASPKAASFGWNNSPVPSPTVAVAPPESETSVNAEAGSAPRSPASMISPFPPPSRPASISGRPLSVGSRPLSMNQIVAAPLSPLGQPPETAEPDQPSEGEGEEEEDDDDEWGEMVSSPTVHTNGKFPPDANGDAPEVPDVTSAILSVPPKEDEAEDEDDDDDDDDDDEWGEMMTSPTVETNGTFPSTTIPLDDAAQVNDIPLLSPALPSPTGSESSPSVAKPAVTSSTPISSIRNSWSIGDFDISGGSSRVSQTARSSPIDKAARPFSSKPLQAITSQATTKSMSLELVLSPPLQSPRENKEMNNPTTTWNNDDEVAADILQKLPDLSYMLR